MIFEEKYMQRCLRLARKGAGNVAPNPMVGSVIVHKGKIIGEGYHRQYGEAHAEVNAINSVKNKKLLNESTIYVNLEPCSHFGKTPPCANLIVKNQIPNVVIGCIDTFSKVAGSGIKILRKGGCNVQVGVLENEARELNRRFFTFHALKRPYIILKWAQTADGFIDIERTSETPIAPFWITGTTEKHHVHKWRSNETAIMVATNTIEKDNPGLTTREWYGKSPLRVLLDRKLRITEAFKIYDNSVKTLIFNEIKHCLAGKTEFIKFESGANYEDIFRLVFDELYKRNIQSVIVEGGAFLQNRLIEHKFWDEARVFVGEKTFGRGKKAAKIRQKAHKNVKFKESTLFFYRNNK